MELYMLLFLSGHMGFQFLHICGNPSLTLSRIGNSVQIKYRLFCPAAYTHRVPVVVIIPCILHIKRSAALACQTLNRRYGNFIASNLKGRYLRRKRARLRMILRGNQLQIGIGAGF